MTAEELRHQYANESFEFYKTHLTEVFPEYKDWLESRLIESQKECDEEQKAHEKIGTILAEYDVDGTTVSCAREAAKAISTLRAEVKRLKKKLEEHENVCWLENVNSLTASLAEADEAIVDGWFIEQDDETGKYHAYCAFCGKVALDNSDKSEYVHPTPSTCIVLKSLGRQKERGK